MALGILIVMVCLGSSGTFGNTVDSTKHLGVDTYGQKNPGFGGGNNPQFPDWGSGNTGPGNSGWSGGNSQLPGWGSGSGSGSSNSGGWSGGNSGSGSSGGWGNGNLGNPGNPGWSGGNVGSGHSGGWSGGNNNPNPGWTDPNQGNQDGNWGGGNNPNPGWNPNPGGSGSGWSGGNNPNPGWNVGNVEITCYEKSGYERKCPAVQGCAIDRDRDANGCCFGYRDKCRDGDNGNFGTCCCSGLCNVPKPKPPLVFVPNGTGMTSPISWLPLIFLIMIGTWATRL